MAEDSDTEIRLDRFLIENSDLFTVFGVFGAIALYFVQIPTEGASGTPQRQVLGFVMSLSLFLTVAFLILKRAIQEVGGILSVFNASWNNLEFVFFLVSFGLLTIASIWVVASRFPQTALISLPLVVFSLGVMTIFYFYGLTGSLIMTFEDGVTIGVDPEFNRSANRLLTLSILLIIATGIVFSLVSQGLEVGLGYLYGLPLKVDYFASAYLLGLISGESILLVLGFSMKMLHVAIRLIIEKDLEEEFAGFAPALGLSPENDSDDDDELPPYIR